MSVFSPQDCREIIAAYALRHEIPSIYPTAIARVESELNPACIGDNGTSFGLFQLHRGGLAPEGYTDDQLMDPRINTSIAIPAMIGAYRAGLSHGLDGFELAKYIAFHSGWPCMLGVEWCEANRPDYVKRLAKMYLDETDIPEKQPQPAPDPENPVPGPARNYYYVQPGDTLSAIGLRVRVPWQVLARYNRLDNPDLIHPGDAIAVPEVYRIKAGDTLSQLCEARGEDYHFVAQVNQIDPDLIATGHTLFL